MKELVNIICISNQLSGSCIVQVFAERCFQRDNNLRRAGGGPIIKQHWKKIAEIPQECDFFTWSIVLANKLYDIEKILMSFYAICYKKLSCFIEKFCKQTC